jgi:predicted metallopeptidase
MRNIHTNDVIVFEIMSQDFKGLAVSRVNVLHPDYIQVDADQTNIFHCHNSNINKYDYDKISYSDVIDVVDAKYLKIPDLILADFPNFLN